MTSRFGPPRPLRSRGRFGGTPDLPSELLDGVQGMTNANTAKIRAALARVIAGTGDAYIAEIGDSTTAGGTGTSPSRYNCRVSALGALLATRFGVTVNTVNAMGSASHTVTANYTTYNPFVTFSGATINNLERIVGGYCFQSTAFSSEWRITPGYSFSRVRLYGRQSASSLIGWRDSTGAQGAVATGNGDSPYAIDVNVTAGSTWVEFFLWSGATVRFTGAHCYSAAAEVALLNCGWSGSDSVDWTEATAAYMVFNALDNLDADLCVINICLNDQGVQTPAAYKANLISIINQCKAGGSDVLVMTGNQRDTALVSFATAQAIRDAAEEAAAETGVPFWFSDLVLGDYTTANANGDMVDQTHPNVQGASKLADAEDAGYFAQVQARM